MATRKKLNKSEFVRSMPDAKASDVVAAAKKKGIKLSDRYVYVIRSSDKAKARRTGVTGPRGRRAGAGTAEAQLRHAIAELGLAAARRILADVESSFS
jgi:hypothetical protein